MSKRTIIMGIVALALLWVVVFLVAQALVSRVDGETEVEALPTPTQRPTRTDVPELLAPTHTPEPTPEPGETQEPSPEPTEEPTSRPTAAFTLSPLRVNRFQRQQQEEFELQLAAQATLEIPRDQGAYPIRLAIEDLGILASVLVVQTDPDFNIVTPRDEVGFYALTSKIGGGGNSVMVGHVYPGRVFNKLLDARVGQIVRITDEFYQEHYYQIEEIIRFPYEIGNPEDRQLGFEYMYDNSEERITLVTCYPEYEWTHRFVVRARPIDPPDTRSPSPTPTPRRRN